MYPFFEPFSNILIYTFWLSLTVSFFVFFWMLKKLWERYNYDLTLFKKNIIWYFISIFIFSRLFYVFIHWSDLKHIDQLSEFFIMTEYNFSLFWAIFWFFIVLFINLKFRKEKLVKYIDWLVLSFLFILLIWYIWALLWGQVYWKETSYWIEIIYRHPYTYVPYIWPVFPLPIVYALAFFVEFSFLYILSIFIKVRWFIWYIWLMLFSIIILIFEFFSWKPEDIIGLLLLKMWSNYIDFNMNQIFAILLFIFAFYKLYIVAKIAWKDTTVLIDKS